MASKRPRSEDIFRRSAELIPGGVNSPVRAFGSVGGTPFIVDQAQGAWLYDVDGNRYVDYVMSWGPLILGHAHRHIMKAIREQSERGVSFGASTEAELTLAALVRERMPWIEKLRLVNSGTEACMTAARIARGATGRNLIVKFDGCYHGHSDLFLVKAGSGLATGGLPGSAGIPDAVTATTLSLSYNDLRAVEETFAKSGSEIAAVIVEPVAANMGVVAPHDGFLQLLRDKTSEHGALLVFDEVITGFRVSPGGAAQLYGIKPDLVCLGKILGGGLPIGAVGGKRELMDNLAPSGSVYQAGTLSGNPLSVAAGIATLKELADASIYDHIKSYSSQLAESLRGMFAKVNVPVQINLVEGLLTLFFAYKPVTDFETAKQADMKLYARFFHSLLDHGLFLPPSGFEAWFVSAAHEEEQLERTTSAVSAFLQ